MRPLELNGYDAEVFTYHRCVSVDLCTAFLATPTVSAAAVDAALNAMRDDRGEIPLRAVAAAARNPATSAEQLLTWVASADSIPFTCVRSALTNPTIGGHIPHLGLTSTALKVALANPAAPTEWITANWKFSPGGALPNPAIDPDLVNEVADRYAEASANPNVRDAVRVASLSSYKARWRAAAAKNPHTTSAELEVFIDIELELDDGDQSWVLQAARQHLEQLTWETDPFGCPAAWLTTRAHHPQVHTALLELGSTSRGAVHNLLRANFDGTVAELFDVAATFT